MSDKELIARLRDWDEYDEGKINDARQAAADRIEALVKESKAAEKEIANLRENYDAVFARAERLEVRCKALIAAYDKANWMRTADYHGDECDCLRCHVDYLRAALKGDEHE